MRARRVLEMWPAVAQERTDSARDPRGVSGERRVIRRLRYKLVRLWLWRHTCIALEYNWFTGHGVFWCGYCGGTIYIAEDAQKRRVLHSTCPVGREVQRVHAP